MPKRRVLVLFAHPVYERSRVNRELVAAALAVEGVTFHDLYEAYPTLNIDVRAEQKLLTEHEAIVLQHPMYWYSAPAIIKEWLDLVLEHGWAYGTQGHALDGKLVLNAVTTGGPAAAYRPEGQNRFTIRTLLSPFDQTFFLCRMRYLAPFVVHGSLRLGAEGGIAPWAARYRRLLELLRDDRLDLDRAAAAEKLEDPETFAKAGEVSA